MKKNISRMLSILFIGVSLVSIKASALGATDEQKINTAINTWEAEQKNKNNSNGYNALYISNAISVNANSNQWGYLKPYWRLATPNFHQAYANTWAKIDGKWYYLDSKSNMVENQVIYDLNTDKKYYVQQDGSMLANGYYTDYYHNQDKYYAGSDGILTLVQNSSTTSNNQTIIDKNSNNINSSEDDKQIDEKGYPTGPWN